MKLPVTGLIIGLMTLSFTQEFWLQNLPIEMTLDGEPVENPFFGGFNKPKNQSLDWDADGDTDIFVLDVDGRLRYYQNIGTPTSPEFILKTTDFQAIPSVNWFYFGDINGDEAMDLITQHTENTSRVMYFENTGNQLVSGIQINQLDGTPVTSDPFMTPTFADIDNDGDADFFTGNYVGTVTFYENVGWEDGAPVFQWMTNAWQNISIIGNTRHGASALQFIDLDDDGDLDLSWGDYYSQSLYIIWNLGSANVPVMDIFNITRSFPENDPVITAGQNMPGFTDLDGDNDPDLIISVLSGAFGNQLINNLYYYENTGSPGFPFYEFRTNHFFDGLDLLTDASPALADIDNDGDLDLFIGNGFEPTSFPWVGRIHFFRNTGTSNIPIWEEENAGFLGTGMGNNLSPVFADMDNDGDQDVMVGEFNGFILYFQNIGSAEEAIFSDQGVPLPGIDLSGHATPALVDLDGDNDYDLVCGETAGNIIFFENSGSPEEFSFSSVVDLITPAPVSSRSAPLFKDVDMDGDQDLLVGSEYENIRFYRNTGDPQSPQFTADTSITIPRLGTNLKLAGGHFLGGDDYQLIVGLSTGGCYHLAFSPCLAGDINSDGTTDILDVVILVNIILDNTELTPTEMCAADINNDQQTDIQDIVSIVFVILEG